VVRVDCSGTSYEIVLFIHSGNPDCYSPGVIAVFDRAKITRLFETIVDTFLPAG